jgi:hypothetical protein
MTEAQKRAQQRWRETHREAYNACQLKFSDKYYQDNKDKVLEYKRKNYIYKKQCEIFRNIEI